MASPVRLGKDVSRRARSAYPPELHNLDTALTVVGAALNSLLDGTRTHGRWNPRNQTWDPQ